MARILPLRSTDFNARAGGANATAGAAGFAAVVFGLWLTGCALEKRPVPPPVPGPVESRGLIQAALLRSVTDRSGWTDDIYASLRVLGVQPSHANVCAIVAVIEQESGFKVDPIVTNLPTIAWRTIDERAAAAGVPGIAVHGLLQLPSPTGKSYSERIDHVKTEKDLSDIFEDFTGSVPMGRTLFSDRNPIRTRGPMQVQTTFAAAFAAAHSYPYPVKLSIADEVFTRRGSIYFGTAHLLLYTAPYDGYVYRFADFNAGQYASRNAAFQEALRSASGVPLIPDGALLPHESSAKSPGATELAARTLGPRLNLDNDDIHRALERGKTVDFERSTLYTRVFDLADRTERRALPRAVLPKIELHSPKFSRRLTTEWYAKRVNERFERCLSR